MQRAELVEKIDSFLAKTGMAPSTFGLKLSNSGNLVHRLRQGISPRAATVAKVTTFIKEKEMELQRTLADAAIAIRKGDGYVQVGSTGDPQNLPKGVTPAIFEQLVVSGQLQPAGDSFLGGRPQTYRPI